MNVIIPSYKRAHDLKGKDYFFMAKYCVPESQIQDYIDVVGEDRVISLPDEQDGDITRKRNWILRNIPRPLIMIDDDVSSIGYYELRKGIKDGNQKKKILTERLGGVDKNIIELMKKKTRLTFSEILELYNKNYKP